MTDDAHSPAPSEGLQEDVDYLFCPVCDKHIPCLRTETGHWEVCCPGCVGECGMCKCYLAPFCFGRREEFPPIDMKSSPDT